MVAMADTRCRHSIALELIFFTEKPCSKIRMSVFATKQDAPCPLFEHGTVQPHALAPFQAEPILLAQAVTLKKTAVFICALLTGFFSIVIGYRLSSEPLWMIIPTYVAEALALGFAARLWPLTHRHHGVIPVAIFCGGLLAVFPVIVVTYGFALVVLVPLLAVWSVMVWLGGWLGNRMHEVHA